MDASQPYQSMRLGVLHVHGPDATEYLRAQLTNDVLRLDAGRHFLAAWCDAKGRVQLLLRVLAVTDGYLLLLPAELIAPALPRLRMFVLRAKVQIDDVSDDWSLTGVLTGDDLPAPEHSRHDARRYWLGLPADAGPGRALVLGPASAEPPPGALAIASAAWQLADIDAGLPQVTTATQGEFVPQMLNLHWLMAVDFSKGCYPGQEVIARLHYRGRLTRRLFRLAWQQRRPTPGEPVHAAGTRVGTMLNAAEAASGGRALAVVATDAAAGEALSDAEGAPLAVCELPYATPA